MATNMAIDGAQVDDVDALAKQVQQLRQGAGSPPLDPEHPPSSPYTLEEDAIVQAADATVTAALGASEFRLVPESDWHSDADVCETDAAGPRPEPGADTALPGLPVSIMSVTAVPTAADGPEADSSTQEAVTNAATQPPAERISTTSGDKSQPTALSAQVSTVTAAVPQSSNSTASTLQNAGETSCNAQVLKALVDEWTQYNEVDSMSDDHLANWVTLCSSIRPCADGTTLSLTASDAAAFTKSLRKARTPPSQRGGNNVQYMHPLRKAAMTAHEADKGPALPKHLYDLPLPGSNGDTTPSEYTIVERPGCIQAVDGHDDGDGHGRPCPILQGSRASAYSSWPSLHGTD